MKSNKKIKDLNEIVLPYLLKAKVSVSGGVNGKMHRFEKGKEYEITYEIFESLYNGGYVFN